LIRKTPFSWSCDQISFSLASSLYLDSISALMAGVVQRVVSSALVLVQNKTQTNTINNSPYAVVAKASHK
jgi:hypothetical protein